MIMTRGYQSQAKLLCFWYLPRNRRVQIGRDCDSQAGTSRSVASAANFGDAGEGATTSQ